MVLPKLKSWQKKAVLSVVSVVFVLMFGECLARLKYHPRTAKFEGAFEYDAETSFRLKRNYTGKFADRIIRTNAYGYRGENFPVEKASGEWRVVMLGDSVTFGHGVDEGDTFAHKYQESLRTEFPDRKILVINTAVPGYSSMQEYYDLIRSLKFKPDVAVIQFSLNDVTEPYLFQVHLGGTGYDYHKVADVSPLHFYLSQRSALYLFLLDLVKLVKFGTTDDQVIRYRGEHMERLTDEDMVGNPSDPRQVPEWKEYFYWLGKISDVCEKEKIPCYILISPYMFQIELEYSRAYPQMQVLDFAKRHHLSTIDMLPVLQDLIRGRVAAKYGLPETVSYADLIHEHLPDIQEEAKRYIFDYDHYTPLGHSVVNRQLLDVIRNPR